MDLGLLVVIVIGVPSRYSMNVCGMNTSLDESAVPQPQRHEPSA